MIDVVVLAAFALLILGVVGSVLPAVPGPVLSIAGVSLFWWSSGYATPGPLLLGVLLALGVIAVAVDLLAGVIGARTGGTSTPTAVLAGIVGLLGLVFVGPLGLLLGVAGTVFAVVVARTGDVRAGSRAALATVLGVLGSALVQALFALAILGAMVAVAL